MDATEFIERLNGFGRGDILAVADAVQHGTETVDGEVGWWRATVAVQDALRYQRRCREAGRVARDAARAVVDAAARAGLDEEQRDLVTRVARAAADAARSLVAGAPGEATTAMLRPFGLVADLPLSRY